MIVKRGVQNRVQNILPYKLTYTCRVSFSTHSLLNFLFLNLLCSCTEKNYIIKSMKNYELDYAQSTHTTCQWSTSVAVMIKLYDFMIRDSLVLIIRRSSITFFRSAVSIPLTNKTRSCPWSATLLYMWTRCNRLFRQFNKKDYTKFKKLKSVKFISSYSTLVSRSVGMISKKYISIHIPHSTLSIYMSPIYSSHSRDTTQKLLTKVKKLHFTDISRLELESPDIRHWS